MLAFSKAREDLIKRFIEYRTSCDQWCEGYALNLLYFDRFCTKHYPDETGVAQSMIDGWCIQRKTENKASLIGRTLPARKFIEYLNSCGLTSLSIPEMPKPEGKEHIPHFFTKEELSKFFSGCDENVISAKSSSKKFYAFQVSVLFRLLYSSGIRTTEARLLRVDDVDLTHGILNIRKTKNSIEHYVVLHDTTAQMLRGYDEIAEQNHPGRELFFPYRGKGPFSPDMLTYEFHKVWDRVNEENAVPYDFRHNYAIQNINSWISLGFDFNDKFFYLSKSMGHTSLESTRYYYSLVPALAAIIQEKTEEGFNEIVPEVPHYEG